MNQLHRSVTLALEKLTDQLACLRESGQECRFVEQAHRVLAQVPYAPELAAMTLRSLAKLNLGGPARELIQIRRDLNVTDHDSGDLADALRGLSNGRVPWHQCEDVFTRNVTTLLRRRPDLEGLTKQLPRSLAALHLFRTTDGRFLISRRREPGRLREWLPSLTEEGEEAAVSLPPRGRLGPTAIIGLKLGSLIRRAVEGTHRLCLSYSHPIYLFEPDVARFAAWLHCADHRDLLDDERVHLFVGPNAPERFEMLLTSEPVLAAPTYHLNLRDDPSTARNVLDATERILTRRNAELDCLLDEIRRRCHGRDQAYWADHLHPPGRVLGITSRQTTMLQYSTRDILRALKTLGYEPHMLIEAKDYHQTSAIEICRRILDLDPIMIVLLDHLRYEFPSVPQQLPFLTWIQDHMANLLCHRAGQSIGPFDFVCGYYKDRCTKQFGYPAEQFLPADVPVSTHVFHNDRLDDESAAAYECDISFVSNASTPIERLYAAAVESYPVKHRAILEAIYDRRAWTTLEGAGHVQPAQAASELVRSTARETGIALPEDDAEFIANNFVYRLFDWGRRQETLEWVAAWARRSGRAFRIYGRGWENHPALSEFAAGPIEHGEPLRRAYRASKISLQLIPSGFRHHRSYEMLASGTLPLTRFCRVDFEDPNSPFPGLRRIVFHDAPGLARLAEHFLTDDAHRHQVAAELRAVVLRKFTYEVVLRRVMQAFRDQFQRQAQACLD